MLRDELPAEELEVYSQLKKEQIAQIALLLMLEEGARRRVRALLSYPDKLSPEPVQR